MIAEANMLKKTGYTEEEFREAVKEHRSIRAVLMALGLSPTGGNYHSFKRRVKILGIDTSHFTGKGHLRNRSCTWNKKIPLEEILVEDSTYTSRAQIKKRLLANNTWAYECSSCGISDWNGKEISLHLDHINGVHNDHRLENLRLLCPNCHSQTSTYAGKNKPKAPQKTKAPRKPKIKKQNLCVDCGVVISYKATRCKSCVGLSQDTKIQWPEIDKLKEMIEKTNYSAVGRELGVSDNAVRKRVKRLSRKPLTAPPEQVTLQESEGQAFAPR